MMEETTTAERPERGTIWCIKTISTSVISRNILYIYIRGDSYIIVTIKIRISKEQIDVQGARTITTFLEPMGPDLTMEIIQFMVDCWDVLLYGINLPPSAQIWLFCLQHHGESSNLWICNNAKEVAVVVKQNFGTVLRSINVEVGLAPLIFFVPFWCSNSTFPGERTFFFTLILH